jgi:hypothetical protein
MMRLGLGLRVGAMMMMLFQIFQIWGHGVEGGTLMRFRMCRILMMRCHLFPLGRQRRGGSGDLGSEHNDMIWVYLEGPSFIIFFVGRSGVVLEVVDF